MLRAALGQDHSRAPANAPEALQATLVELAHRFSDANLYPYELDGRIGGGTVTAVLELLSVIRGNRLVVSAEVAATMNELVSKVHAAELMQPGVIKLDPAEAARLHRPGFPGGYGGLTAFVAARAGTFAAAAAALLATAPPPLPAGLAFPMPPTGSSSPCNF